MTSIRILNIPVTVHPRNLNRDLYKTIKETVIKNSLYKIMPEVGIVTKIIEIVKTEEKRIQLDDGSVKFLVGVQAEVYLPKVKDVVEYPIVQMIDMGIYVKDVPIGVQWAGIFVQTDPSPFKIGDRPPVKITKVSFRREDGVDSILILGVLNDSKGHIPVFTDLIKEERSEDLNDTPLSPIVKKKVARKIKEKESLPEKKNKRSTKKLDEVFKSEDKTSDKTSDKTGDTVIEKEIVKEVVKAEPVQKLEKTIELDSEPIKVAKKKKIVKVIKVVRRVVKSKEKSEDLPSVSENQVVSSSEDPQSPVVEKEPLKKIVKSKKKEDPLVNNSDIIVSTDPPVVKRRVKKIVKSKDGSSENEVVSEKLEDPQEKKIVKRVVKKVIKSKKEPISTM